jgi:very-short-patch-repair endonuclease
VETGDAACATVAASQHGCITLEQARICGLRRESVRRRVRSGRWRRVLPQTYVLRGTPRTWEQRLWAAILWVGPGAAVSGRAAAALWGFPGFSPGRVEVSHGGVKQSRDGIRVRRVDLDAGDVTTVRGIPATTTARTLADLAGHVTEKELDIALHHCLHARLATVQALEDVLVRRSGPGFVGAGRLREAIAAYSGGPAAASPLEARIARLLHRAGLPRADRQHPVRLAGGTRYLDFAWPAKLVGLEVDGYRWHSSRTAWRRDRERLAALRKAGWKILHVSQDDLRRGFDAVLDDLRTLLQ